MNRGERGYVLVATLALMAIIAALTAVRFLQRPVADLELQPIRDSRSRDQDLLEDARLRLVTGAIQNENNPGALPCPDRVNKYGFETSCNALQAKIPGRFPYKDRGAPMLPTPANGSNNPVTDHMGECVWYALSPSFRKSNVQLGSRLTSAPDMLPINPNNYGSLFLNNQVVIAVLIAPGKPILNQNFTQGESQFKRGSQTPCNTGEGTAFLETLESVSNAGIDGAFADAGGPTAIDTATGRCVRKSSIANPENTGSACNNDVVIPIRRDDLMKPLIREVLTRLTAPSSMKDSNEQIPSAVPGLRAALSGQRAATLDSIRSASGTYAFDVTVFGEDLMGIPEANGCFRSNGDDPRPLWLCANQWYKYIEYDGADTLTIQLDRGRANSFKCSANLADSSRKVTCS